MIRVAFLGALLAVVAAVGRRRSRAHGLRALRASDEGFDDLSVEDVPAVARAFDRLSTGRRRGAMAGALVFAVPSLILAHNLSLNLNALLAGSAAGTAAAMWRQSRRETPHVRVARLGRRTVVGLVGRRSVGLLVVTAGVALLATADWLRLHPHLSGTWTQTRPGGVCATSVPSGTGVLLSALATVLALGVCLAAAVRIARAGADQSITASADLALREVGIGSCIGCAVAVAAAQAAGMLFLLPTVIYGPCGTFDGALRWRIDGFLLAALGFLLVAVWSLFRFVVAPVRFKDTRPKASAR